MAISVRDLRKSYGDTPAVRETVTLFASFYRHPRRVEETIELAGLAAKRDAWRMIDGLRELGIVRFRLPAGVSAEAIAGTLRSPVETDSDEATTRTSDAHRVLYRLTGWAENEGVRLEGIEVVRPRLDDMYLELMAPEASRG